MTQTPANDPLAVIKVCDVQRACSRSPHSHEPSHNRTLLKVSSQTTALGISWESAFLLT